jgi:hypothetical protein
MIKRHWNYLKYVIRHKFYVLLACSKLRFPVRYGILHDISKFKPSEWIPYASCFYKENGESQYDETEAFNLAWNEHQKSNKHHWQYWVIIWDRGQSEALRIPERYIQEMVADWMGAGRAINGKWEVCEWYEKNKRNMILHPDTRMIVEIYLENW